MSSSQLAGKQQEERLMLARHAIEQPWSRTEAELLDAIACLEAVPTPQSVETLQTAFEMTKAQLVTQSKASSLERPRAGQVSGRAARALARIDHPDGLGILAKVISSQACHSYLRESAAYGLGGVTKVLAFSALAAGLEDPEPEVRSSALLAVKESFDALRGRRCPEQEPVLKALTALVLCPQLEAAPRQKEEAALRRRLLKKFPAPLVEELILDTLLNSDDPQACALALDLLYELEIANTRRILAQCLLAKDRHPSLYHGIALMVKGSRDQYMLAAARRVTQENMFLPKLLGWFMPQMLESFLARRLAAEAILQLS